MKTAKEIILERAGELFCMVHSTTCARIVEGMKEYANQIGCKCAENIKHGTTTIKCCNHCGKPTEDFWINQNKD